MPAYPGDSNYGKCDDCGGSAYAMGPNREQYCRECHGDRNSFLARNPWARANVLSYFSETNPWLHTYTPEQRAHWDAGAPKRSKQRDVIRLNLAAYACGDFPGDASLIRGTREYD